MTTPLPQVDQTASQEALHALALASGRLVIATDGEDRLREERIAVLNALKDYERAAVTTSGTEERLVGQPSLLIALDACMSAFNGLENFFSQRGKVIHKDDVITLERVHERAQMAQSIVLKALELHEASLPSVSQEEISAAGAERIAELIYSRFLSYDDHGVFYRWIAGGNSLKQDDARRFARRLLDEAGLVSQEEIRREAFKAGVEASARLIEELDTNNVGMLHPLAKAQAERIRALISSSPDGDKA